MSHNVPVAEYSGDEIEVITPTTSPEGDEELHMPAPSFGPLLVAVGALLLLLGILQPLLLAPALLVTGYGVWKMIHFPDIDLHAHWLSGLDDRKLGMWIFLASEVLFFGSLIGGFLYFKVAHRFEDVSHILNLPLATVGTSVLIVSSFAVVMGLEAIQANDRRVFFTWMGITIALGATFLGIQALEWTELMSHEITAETLFGTAFFVTTGFHGMHVLGGVVWLGLVLFRAARGVYSGQDYLGVELFGLYWHFVDIVWIVLFTVIYLIQ